MPYLRYLTKRAFFALITITVFLPAYLLSLVPSRDAKGSAGVSRAPHEHAQRRKHLPSPAFLTLPALAVFLTVYFLGLVPASGDSGGAGPVRIENVRINRLPQSSSPRIEMDVELKNHDPVAHEIQVWWLLAKPGANRPWNLYAFRSSIQGPRILEANQEIELNWQEEITAEPGTYELSVWVHTVEGNVSRHSDGTRLGSPSIRVDSQWSRFSRRATPPAGLQVSTVDLLASAFDAGLSVPTELPVTIVVTNDTATETVADIQWYLYHRSSRLPWNGTPAYTSRELQHQVFAPNSQTAIRTSELISLWPGEYVLRVVATESDGEGIAASDDLFLNDPITVLESDNQSTVIRAAPPSGPVEIANLAADAESFQRGQGSVTVNLLNRSDREQKVVLWWFLSRPGALQPWVEFDVQSKVLNAEIAAHQLSILSLSDSAYPPPGTYELSVWVHTLDGQGGEHPNDGAWFNRRIEVH